MACKWLHSAVFWMKEASAEDSSPPFILIHSNRPGISSEITSWNLQLILLKVFPHATLQMPIEKTYGHGKKLNYSLERNNRPSLCRTMTANSASGALLFQPGSALQRIFSSQIGLNTFLSSLYRRNFFGGCCGFSNIMFLHCLMHEPMLKSSQLWSIKSSFQWLLKFCMWIKNCCCCRRAGNLLMLQCCDAMWFYWKNSRTEENINHDTGRKQHAFQHLTFEYSEYFIWKIINKT